MWIDGISGHHRGMVGDTVRMVIITCILSNISCLGSWLCSFLTVTLDMRCERWSDGIHRPSSPGLDRSDGRSLNPKQRDVAIHSSAITSNRGASTFTICASLAGLLWRDILRQKGIGIHQGQFCRLNLPLVVVSMVTPSMVLVGETCVVHKNRKISLGQIWWYI